MTATADTITDDQIRDLRDGALKSSPRFVDDTRIIRAACWALGESRWLDGVDCRIPPGYEDSYRKRGRRTCAEIINARAKDHSPLPMGAEDDGHA